jgi:hypothetical protein
MGARLGSVTALERTAAAARRAGDRLVHDALDGAGAPAALGAAAKTAIDLAGSAGSYRRGDGATDVVVAEHVTGADDHEQGRILLSSERYMYELAHGSIRIKKKNASLSDSKLPWWQVRLGQDA